MNGGVISVGLALALFATSCGSGVASRHTVAPPVEPTHPTWRYRAVAGPVPVTDSQGVVWGAGSMVGGTVVTAPAKGQGAAATSVANTGSPQLYGQARIGIRSVTIQVPGPGTYVVDLLMTEPSALSPGQRVFDVTAGATTIKSIDIAGAVGDNAAFHQFITTAVPGKTLQISFTSRVGAPELSALAAVQLSNHGGLTTTWQDQFPGTAGSTPKGWTYTTGQTGFGNQEVERYTSSPANSAIDGKGALVITVRHEIGTYTSARLNSQASFQYGLVQAQIKLPYGQALWPGFWMLADDIDTVGWPASGEIDILEAIGQSPNGVHAGVIGPGSDGSGSNWDLQGYLKAQADLTGGFHTYAALWTPLGVSFMLDGKQFFSATPEDLLVGDHWVEDRRFHLLLNVAVGGRFPGPVTSATPPTSSMIVKGLKVSQ